MKKALLQLLASAMLLAIMPQSALSKEPIKIGVAAMISPKETLRYYQAMLEYIGDKAGEKVSLVQRPSYADMDELLKDEEVKIAFVCSGPYVKDHAAFGAELLVAPVSYGQAFYHAYIIAAKDSPIKSLTEMKGRSFVFTDPHSNTGCLVPTYMVGSRFNQTPEEFFSKIQYAMQHDKSIEMVAKGLADGAAVDSLIYDYSAATNPVYTSQTRIVEKSPAYGVPPIVTTKGLNPQLKAKLKKAFLEMAANPKGKAILAKIGIDRFIVPDDKNYDTIREMEEWIKNFKKESPTGK